jgi:putative DNA primase/helicase
MKVPPADEFISTRRVDPVLSNDVVTEDSAAVQFVELYGKDLRYCHSTASWFRWNIVRWQRDLTGATFQSARQLSRDLGEDVDESGRKVIGKTSFAAGVERFARSDQAVAVIIDYWDANPWLLGTPGGTVDLQTGVLRESHRDDGITKTTVTAPSDQADCPLWLRFLREATGDDEELIRFLQQWCGYALTGVTREHALVFVYGPGGNGKSVFLNIVTAILKDYAATSTSRRGTHCSALWPRSTSAGGRLSHRALTGCTLRSSATLGRIGAGATSGPLCARMSLTLEPRTFGPSCVLAATFRARER